MEIPTKWPLVPLGDVLRQVVDSHPVRADQTYPNFGIYSFGRGLFAKPAISGAVTSAKSLYRARKGWFIYSRLFAFEGAYGLVTDEFDGCFVSNEYPMFEWDDSRIHLPYLERYFKWSSTWKNISHLATGMGDRRRRIQPEQFLTHKFPLPVHLEEQQQVVAELSRLEEVQRLHIKVGNELEALYHIVLTRAFQGES